MRASRVAWLAVVGVAVIAAAASVMLHTKRAARTGRERDAAIVREQAAAQKERAARRHVERALAAERGARAALLSLTRPGDFEALRLGLQAVSVAADAVDDTEAGGLRALPPRAIFGLTAAVQARSYPRFSPWTHDRRIQFAGFSPDGTAVLTASEDGELRHWDVKTGKERARFASRGLSAHRVSVSADGSHMVTVDEQGARLWDAKTGDLLALLERSAAKSVAADFTPDGHRVFTTHRDDTARLWAVRSPSGIPGEKSGALLATIPGCRGWPCDAGFSPDGTRIATAGDGQAVLIRDLKTGAVLRRPTGHTAPITAVRFSPDGRRLLTMSEDRTARLFGAQGSVVSGAPLTIRGHAAEILDAAFSPKGTRIATASNDRTARLWSAEDGTHLATLDGHTAGVLTVAFSPDGTRLLTTSRDHTARLWDATAGIISSIAPLATFPASGDRLLGAAFSPDGKHVLLHEESGVLLFAVGEPKNYDEEAEGSTAPAVLNGHDAMVTTAVFSPDGRRLVTAGSGGIAYLWVVTDAPGVKPSAVRRATLRSPTDSLCTAAFSPDGRRLATAGSDGTAHLWDAQGAPGALLATLHGHTDAACAVAFSPDGQRLVTASSDKTARLWDIPSGRLLSTLRGHRSALQTAAFSPDGHRILTGSLDGTARLWDVSQIPVSPSSPSTTIDAALFTLTLDTPYGHVSDVGFSPDGASLLTHNRNERVQVWDAKTGARRGHLDSGSWTPAVGFSPDGRLVLTQGDSWVAQIWDTQTAARLATMKIDGSLAASGFTANNTRLLTTGNYGQLWDVRTGELLARFTDPRLFFGHVAAISPDGALVLVSHQFGQPLLFSSRLSTYAARACELLAGHPAELQPVAELCRPDNLARLKRPL